MGWLVALGILLLIGMLPLGASVSYDAGGPLVRVIAGPVKLTVFPGKPKPEKKKEKPKEKPKKKQTGQPKKEKTPKPDNGGSWKDFLPLVDVALGFLGDLRRKLRVDRLELHTVLAGDDPCDLGVLYGRMNGAVAALLAKLDAVFVIRHQDVSVGCDFMADQTRISARLDITMTVGRLLSLVLRNGIRALKTYLEIKKHREGGANL